MEPAEVNRIKADSSGKDFHAKATAGSNLSCVSMISRDESKRLATAVIQLSANRSELARMLDSDRETVAKVLNHESISVAKATQMWEHLNAVKSLKRQTTIEVPVLLEPMVREIVASIIKHWSSPQSSSETGGVNMAESSRPPLRLASDVASSLAARSQGQPSTKSQRDEATRDKNRKPGPRPE
jgi:hypothetical protein